MTVLEHLAFCACVCVGVFLVYWNGDEPLRAARRRQREQELRRRHPIHGLPL